MRLDRAAVLVVIIASTFSAQAAQRTFVSGGGSDLNACTRDMPCRSFAASIAATDPNGEVIALDSAGYGPFTVTQPVAVIAPFGVYAGISVFAGDGVTVNTNTTDTVVLRNLYINSQGGSNGITLTSTRDLYIEHCVVTGFSAHGINLLATPGATIAITETDVRNAGQAGIYFDGSSATLNVDRCRMERNGSGILVDRGFVAVRNCIADRTAGHGFHARGIGGIANMTIDDSTSSSNSGGVVVENGVVTVHHLTAQNNVRAYWTVNGSSRLSIQSSIAAANTYGVYLTDGDITVDNSTVADNTTSGVNVVSGTASLTGNVITRNATGVANSGTVYTLGDNFIHGNGTETSGTAFSVVTAK